MIKRRAKKCHSHDPGGTSFAFSGIVCKCAICSVSDLNTRGSLRRKINMSVNVLKIHVPMHEQVAKRDWKGNRTKSLRNSFSVKDSIGVLIAGWSSGNFRCIFSLSSPLRCEMMEISRVTFFARNEQNAYRIAQTGRREYYSRVWRKIMDKRCG